MSRGTCNALTDCCFLYNIGFFIEGLMRFRVVLGPGRRIDFLMVREYNIIANTVLHSTRWSAKHQTIDRGYVDVRCHSKVHASLHCNCRPCRTFCLVIHTKWTKPSRLPTQLKRHDEKIFAPSILPTDRHCIRVTNHLYCIVLHWFKRIRIRTRARRISLLCSPPYRRHRPLQPVHLSVPFRDYTSYSTSI